MVGGVYDREGDKMTIREEFDKAFNEKYPETKFSSATYFHFAEWAFIQGMKKASELVDFKDAQAILSAIKEFEK